MKKVLIGFTGLTTVALLTVVAYAAGHPEVGPHKGPLVEWGEEEYHLEVVVDAKEKTVTVYVLDGEVKKAKPIDAKQIVLTLKQKPPVTVKLEAMPEKTDPTGKSSRYVGKHDAFGKGGKLEGSVSGKVGDKPYAGDFKQK
jgi:hypothetical protein